MPVPTLTIGTTGKHRFGRRPFQLTGAEIATHKHVIGVTGMGKSKWT